MLGRRAQGISINVIIIAAIALVVMVILVALVFNTGRQVQQGTSCNSLPGATCVSPENFEITGCGQSYTEHRAGACQESTEDRRFHCCIPS